MSILEALARKEKETGRETNTEEKKENSGGTWGMHRSKDRHTWEQETKGDQDRRAPRRGESHWKEASRDRSPSVKRERESKRDKEYEDNRKHWHQSPAQAVEVRTHVVGAGEVNAEVEAVAWNGRSRDHGRGPPRRR